MLSLIAAAILHFFPRQAKYIYFAPVLGSLTGSMLWGISTVFNENFLKERTFLAFITISITLMEFVVHRIDFNLTEN
jgi:hypothetical protein